MKTIDHVLATVTAVAGQRHWVQSARTQPPKIGADTDLMLELDLDSVAILEVIGSLEERFEVPLMDNLIDTAEIGTPRRIAARIDSELEKKGR